MAQSRDDDVTSSSADAAAAGEYHNQFN